MTIVTARLELVPLTPAFLRAGLAGDWDEAERVLGARIPAERPDLADVMKLRLAQLEANPSEQPWLLRAMVRRDSREMIGNIGFHAPPGAEYLRAWSPLAAEFGYEVAPRHRRQGFAREAALALMHWARVTHGVPAFILTIAPANAASQQLAAELGFRRIGSHIDEIDGEEDVLELAAAPPPAAPPPASA